MSSTRLEAETETNWTRVGNGMLAGGAYQLGGYAASGLISLFSSLFKSDSLAQVALKDSDNVFREAEEKMQAGKYDIAERLFKEAEKHLNEACAKDKNVANNKKIIQFKNTLLYNRAKCLFILRDYIKPLGSNAVFLLDLILKQNPLDREALNLRGLIYLKLALIDLALIDEKARDVRHEYIENAINDFKVSFYELQSGTSQNDIYILLLFAKAFQASQQAKPDLSQYKLILTKRCDASDSGIIRNEIYMLFAIAAKICIQMGEADDGFIYTNVALQYIDRALQLTPDNPAFYIEEALLLQLQSAIYAEIEKITANKLTRMPVIPFRSESKEEKEDKPRMQEIEKEHLQAQYQEAIKNKEILTKKFQAKINEINTINKKLADTEKEEKESVEILELDEDEEVIISKRNLVGKASLSLNPASLHDDKIYLADKDMFADLKEPVGCRIM